MKNFYWSSCFSSLESVFFSDVLLIKFFIAKFICLCIHALVLNVSDDRAESLLLDFSNWSILFQFFVLNFICFFIMEQLTFVCCFFQSVPQLFVSFHFVWCIDFVEGRCFNVLLFMAGSDLMFVKEPLNLSRLILVQTVFSPFYWKSGFWGFVKRYRFKFKVVIRPFTEDLFVPNEVLLGY